MLPGSGSQPWLRVRSLRVFTPTGGISRAMRVRKAIQGAGEQAWPLWSQESGAPLRPSRGSEN